MNVWQKLCAVNQFMPTMTLYLKQNISAPRVVLLKGKEKAGRPIVSESQGRGRYGLCTIVARRMSPLFYPDTTDLCLSSPILLYVHTHYKLCAYIMLLIIIILLTFLDFSLLIVL